MMNKSNNDNNILTKQDTLTMEIVDNAGTVYLPGKAKLKTHDEKFDNAIRDYIPSDIANYAITLTKRHKYSFVQVVLIVSTVIVLFYTFYVFFPVTEIKLSGVPKYLDINPPKNQVIDKKFLSLRNKATAHYTDKEFYSCIKILSQTVKQIKDENTGKENAGLIYLFLDSVYKVDNEDNRQIGYNLAVYMNSLFPDELCWKLYVIELPRISVFSQKYSPFAYSSIWNMLRKSKFNFSDNTIDYNIQTLENINKNISQAIHNTEIQGDNVLKDYLEVKKAQILTSLWVLKGYKQNWSDEPVIDITHGDISGIAEREEAFNSVKEKQYNKSSDMLDIRKFIVDKTMEIATFWYYWNGQKRFSEMPLRNEKKIIKEIEESIDRGIK